MKRSNAMLIGVSAAVMACAAVWVTRGPRVQDEAGELFLPGLAERSKDIAAVEVLRGEATVRLERGGDGSWAIVSTDNYPVHTELVRALVVSLGDLRLFEPMTEKTARHGELGLAWPDAQGRSRRVRLLAADAAAEPVTDVVLGDERAQPDSVFVRKFDVPETWRARGRVQLPGDAMSWVDRSLLSMPDTEMISASLRGLTLTRPDLPPPSGGPPPKWTPSATGEGWTEAQIQSAQMGLAPFLQRLEFENVRRRGAEHPDDPDFCPVFETKGATIAIKGHKEPDGVWFRVEVTPRPGVAMVDDSGVQRGDPYVPNYERLAARTAPWEYRMPQWKAEALSRTK